MTITRWEKYKGKNLVIERGGKGEREKLEGLYLRNKNKNRCGEVME